MLHLNLTVLSLKFYNRSFFHGIFIRFARHNKFWWYTMIFYMLKWKAINTILQNFKPLLRARLMDGGKWVTRGPGKLSVSYSSLHKLVQHKNIGMVLHWFSSSNLISISYQKNMNTYLDGGGLTDCISISLAPDDVTGRLSPLAGDWVNSAPTAFNWFRCICCDQRYMY